MIWWCSGVIARHFHLLASRNSSRQSVAACAPATTLKLIPCDMASDEGTEGNLARDCKAFYEKRLRLTSTVTSRWNHGGGDLQEGRPEAGDPFSRLPGQIAQLRSELLSLAHMDNELFKHLLALNDKLEELKLHKMDSPVHRHSDEASESHTTEEYDDDDIDEEVEDDQEEAQFYSSLPPAQMLEQASVQAEAAAAASELEPHTASNHGLDVIGGLKFMLRSRSFLLRPPFHKKSNTLTRTTPRRSRLAESSSSSPFR